MNAGIERLEEAIMMVGALLAILLVNPLGHAGLAADQVTVPNWGIQPQAVVDSKGALHLICFK